jgi:general secretion pathway protein G
MFEVDVGRYPTTAEGLAALHEDPGSKGWKGPYLKREVPKDPWGRSYGYRSPGEHNKQGFDVWSSGEDGEEGTEDDVTNWR